MERIASEGRVLLEERIAAADPSGELGRTISAAGRATIASLVAQVLLQAREQLRLGFSDPDEALWNSIQPADC